MGVSVTCDGDDGSGDRGSRRGALTPSEGSQTDGQQGEDENGNGSTQARIVR